MTDSATKDWVRNAADEKAAANGCRFDGERGQFVVDWIEKYLRLYQGDQAGRPLVLLDWARDATLRMFGWVRRSSRWGRWVRRFRQASIWLAKKNGKSPMLAAWSLYLLAGDGEQGQNVYLAAKDGRQAKEIAGKHAIEMVLSSPELLEECTINKGAASITHERTRSTLLPLSSANSRRQEAKEGLNGSVMIDETHVVDREFVSRISRAGISRSEPLQVEVSTAGNNPDGYGKERFDYALEVEKGVQEDEDLFVAVYAAPQDLADADLDADPLKYARLANPALGQTVDPEELLRDYQRSKKSLRKLADFKMYRANVWQRSANPWLKGADWDRCRLDFSEADLAGRECWAALDLSKTQDMTALVLCFRGDDPDTYRLLPYFWLPEAVAREKEHLVSFLAWARGGHLELTPGDVIDYGWIRSRFRDLAGKFLIRELAYDVTYAEETTQALEQGVLDAAGNEVEAGTGVPRLRFPQTLMAFTGPCAEFERLVIAGRLHHNGHPILTWQAGHVQVRAADANRNIRPVKPSRDDVRKIDGVVAAIMALDRCRKSPPSDGGGFETW